MSGDRFDAYGAGASRDKLANWDRFVADARARLEVGRVEYGDRSFERPVTQLMGEIRQELLDVLTWGYVACERLEKQAEVLAGLEAEENRLLARIQYLKGQEREAEGNRNHPTNETLSGQPRDATAA